MYQTVGLRDTNIFNNLNWKNADPAYIWRTLAIHYHKLTLGVGSLKAGERGGGEVKSGEGGNVYPAHAIEIKNARDDYANTFKRSGKSDGEIII